MMEDAEDAPYADEYVPEDPDQNLPVLNLAHRLR